MVVEEINPGWDWKTAIPSQLVLYRELMAIEKTCVEADEEEEVPGGK